MSEDQRSCGFEGNKSVSLDLRYHAKVVRGRKMDLRDDWFESYGTWRASSFVTIASAESVVVENGIVSTGSLLCDLSDGAQSLFMIHITGSAWAFLFRVRSIRHPYGSGGRIYCFPVALQGACVWSCAVRIAVRYTKSWGHHQLGRCVAILLRTLGNLRSPDELTSSSVMACFEPWPCLRAVKDECVPPIKKSKASFSRYGSNTLRTEELKALDEEKQTILINFVREDNTCYIMLMDS